MGHALVHPDSILARTAAEIARRHVAFSTVSGRSCRDCGTPTWPFEAARTATEVRRLAGQPVSPESAADMPTQELPRLDNTNAARKGGTNRHLLPDTW